MNQIFNLASASAALTVALSLLAARAAEPTAAASVAPPPRGPAAATVEAAPVRTVRIIPVDGRYGAAVRPPLR